MTKKYIFGNPYDTEVVEKKIIPSECKDFPLKYEFKNNNIYIHYEMVDNELVYGLGENMKGVNKRGGEYISYCTDEYSHTNEKKSLYGAHNFLMFSNENRLWGLFIDNPEKIKYDIGFHKRNQVEIIIYSENLLIYIFEENDYFSLVKEFVSLFGHGYAPPKWAFGFQQCRWSYKNAEKVNEIADKFLSNKIPCDTIYLDIDYMDNFKVFTTDKTRFSGFQNFVKKMKEKGFRLIPIIDPAVKIENKYRIYEEGVKEGYFCKKEDGKEIVIGVWPGKSHLPDFINKKVRDWWGNHYKFFTDMGIEGFWNDMNEPAIFYSEEGLNSFFALIKDFQDKNLDIYSFFTLRDKIGEISNSKEDFNRFYHKTLSGEKIVHDKVHNLYGLNMTRAAAEGFEKINPEKRFLLFSRASYLGIHKYGGIWTGDNMSWWEHILLNLKMIMSLNMCGILYSGGDTGGFGSDATGELVTRWTQLSVFTPLFRNHAAGSKDQEPFAFEEEITAYMREHIKFRYALIPYIYSEYMKNMKNCTPYMYPLTFIYNSDRVREIEDQALVGDSLMIAPIYVSNAKGRHVFLPEKMLYWPVKSYDSRNISVLNKGDHYINADLCEIPLFIRRNKILVLSEPAQNVDKMDNSQVRAIVFIGDTADYIFYDDDGFSKKYKNEDHKVLEIKVEKKEDSGYNISIKKYGDSDIKKIVFEIYNEDGFQLEVSKTI